MTVDQQKRFLELLEPLYPRLERFALSMCWRREDARELVCETVAIACEQFHALRNEATFLSYLFTIASRCYHAERKRRQRTLAMSSIDIDELYAGGARPDEILQLKELYSAIAQLSDDVREVFVMAEITGLSHKEIAEALDLSIANVKVRVHRARLRLKQILSATEIIDTKK